MELNNKSRNINIDLVKFICAFGVISIHVKTNSVNSILISEFFSHLCVPFFLLCSLVFFISGIKNKNINVIAKKMWVRIVIPYLFWTLIYVSLIILKKHLINQSYDNNWWQILFFGQSSVQLYYIPKMINTQFLALSVILMLNKQIKMKIIGVLIFIVSLSWYLIGSYNCVFGFNYYDCILCLLYMILAFIFVKLKNNNLLRSPLYILGFILLMLFVFLKFFFLNQFSQFFPFFLISDSNIFFNILGSVSLILISFASRPITISKKIDDILSCSYGVYLCHVLFIEAFEFGISFFKINLFYDFWVRLLFSFTVLFLSVIFVKFIKKTQILKRFLLGE